jgi:2-aminoadipate transaminase
VLQYGTVAGYRPLIDALVPRLHATGVHTTASGVHITTGATGALHAVCLATITPGSRVLVADPSYGIDTFTGHGAIVDTIPCDEDGITPDGLDHALRRGPARFVYLTPTFANPTGATMPSARRAAIATIARHHKTLLVEDDTYRDLSYDGRPVPALHAHAPDLTVYIGSLSKTVAPALRIGYAVAPTTMHKAMLAIKERIDMQTSTLTQAVAAAFLTDHYDGHLDHTRPIYAARRDALCDGLSTMDGVRFTPPEGGVFVWVERDGLVLGDAFTIRAAAAGVVVMPGKHFRNGPRPGVGAMRLAFAGLPVDRIRVGTSRLAGLLDPDGEVIATRRAGDDNAGSG